MFSLYRKGFTHTVRGFQCELIRVAEGELPEYRAAGWVDDIEELNAEAPKPKSKPGPKPKSPEVLDVSDENE